MWYAGCHPLTQEDEQAGEGQDRAGRGQRHDFLHQSGILHRDLKPDNVLIISLSGKADINAKLTDFGTSRAVGGNAARTSPSPRVADGKPQLRIPHIPFLLVAYTSFLSFLLLLLLLQPIYMAPEILGHQDYSEKADVYSFAIMLWALVAAREPYSEFKTHGVRPTLPSSFFFSRTR